MKVRGIALFCTGILLASTCPDAFAECFRDANYRVCTDTYTDSSGNIHVRSYDSEGNSYRVDTESQTLPGGGTEIRSSDSEGSSYSLRSWADSSGVHSVDSEGNRCTITNYGAVIGCGQ
jgi:phage-related tail fiber protein